MVCSPIIYQQRCLGAVYLENKLLSNAFTESRLLAVKLLGSQIAIALQNAYQYADLERTITERSHELQSANNRLVAMTRENAETQMAGGFAHEMRNALGGARLTVESLQRDNLVEANSDAVKQVLSFLKETMDEQVFAHVAGALSEVAANDEVLYQSLTGTAAALERGCKITDLVLEYSQIGRLSAHRDPVVVSTVVDRLMTEFAADLNAHHIDISVENIAEIRVRVGEDHLYAILRNLIANARDALKMAEVTDNKRWVTIKGTVHDDRVKLTVADSGPGIPEHLQGRLFEPFFSTKGANGTGLGLGICQKLTRLYGGDITFSSSAQTGTSFFVEIPLSKEA